MLILLNPNRMADVNLIKDLAIAHLLMLDKHYLPNDIIEGVEQALDYYENLLEVIEKNVQTN